MFMFLVEDSQMSLMKDRQVEFHSYLTIWTKIELNFDRILWIDFGRLSTALYCRISSTTYPLKEVRWSSGSASHFC